MSLNPAFTKGPWRLVDKLKDDRLDAWILAKDLSSNSGRELQVIDAHDQHPIKEHLERRLADMKLITAAPEMYATLQAILNDDYKNIGEMKDQINHVLSKAINH